MGLRDIGASLPPGFRFYPSDEELVLHYLYKKVTNEEVLKGTLMDIDLHTCEPWQLPEVAKLNANEWYFFSFRDRKYATGFRTNRATTSGYWKATGKDRTVFDPATREVVGMRKTLVFYRNRAPNGIKTGWIMHEFRLETPHMPPKEDWVLCRVFHKGKTDNSAKLMYETTVPSLTLSSPTNQTTPVGYNQLVPFSSSMGTHHHYHHHQNQNQNQNSLMSLLQFSRETNTNSSTVTQISPKCDDGYEFLWDMDLDDGVASNMDGMRFEVDNNSVVLI
ncbi:protein CUP-SHAPED COTYLEDON 3 [Cajanus cajan]|uniref:Protein CUP-SHAPED COTYLEDON 3 n=1 Tax=Cajanus cajan TaxID=3821 RepID=A0A151U4K8_CAJCA|nr:protein CUP-SHAPED COTYLEDON 3 [Cajanus cajan]KYP74168.1 Protein CUP-SHAPED COTYLEDON 3 [Cajanus cajan]